MSLLTILEDIKPELSALEEELQQWVKSPSPLLSAASSHLLNAGGKRLRPALAILCARPFAYQRGPAVRLGAALELVHMATLVHDDVVDCSILRRGQPTVKAVWGDQVSLHAGDHIFARALMCIATIENPRVASVLAEVSVKMSQGEITQILTTYDPDQSVRDYFKRIRYKTALLLSASCELGATVGRASDRAVQALSRYGYFLGMAFQITDDVLDIVADASQLGKPTGSDLQQGIFTLPVILALRRDSGGQRLRELLAQVSESEILSESLEMVRASGAVEDSLETAQNYVAKAKACLHVLPPCEHVNVLGEIADFVGNRDF
ncbi:MAG: heptaprenyl diphosphate synthase [Clostridia bacterium]|nr:MAG: heptaprenyl diphosphate synthase [Clostridia bacterium]